MCCKGILRDASGVISLPPTEEVKVHGERLLKSDQEKAENQITGV